MKKRGFQATFAVCVLVLGAGMLSCGGDQPGAPATAEPAADRPAAPAAPLGTAQVSGTVTYQGEIPRLTPVSMGADPACEAMHHEPVQPEILVLGEGNTMANVFVRVKSGLPDQTFAPPSEPVVMDQKGCQYIPHVIGVMAGQPLRILNSDGILHNVHALPQVNREFNLGMPATVTEATRTFDRPEDMFQVKCDVHPWMAAYIGVMAHPFYSVTQKDGQFSIAGLPAGTYEVEAWHERLGTQSASVTLSDGGSETVDFTFAR